jgi:hypothetical protein
MRVSLRFVSWAVSSKSVQGEKFMSTKVTAKEVEVLKQMTKLAGGRIEATDSRYEGWRDELDSLNIWGFVKWFSASTRGIQKRGRKITDAGYAFLAEQTDVVELIPAHYIVKNGPALPSVGRPPGGTVGSYPNERFRHLDAAVEHAAEILQKPDTQRHGRMQMGIYKLVRVVEISHPPIVERDVSE